MGYLDSYDATYWLAGANLFVSIMAVLFTLKPVVSVFHVIHLYAIISFGIRPMLAASVGGFSNYAIDIGCYAYNYGILYQLIFSVCFSLVYVIFFNIDRSPQRDFTKVPPPTSAYIAFAVGVGFIIMLHIISHGSWLPGARGVQTINNAAPGAKYIFPFAAVALAVLIPLSSIMLIGKAKINRWAVVAMLSTSLILLSLLYMRGIVISSAFVVLWMMEKHNQLKAWHIIVGLIMLFVVGNTLRPMASMISSQISPVEKAQVQVVKRIAERLSFLDKIRFALLYTTNNDLADTWPVLIDYVECYGYSNGRSFLAIPARFTSTQFRVDNGYLTGSDTLNMYYYGDDYAEKSFGFNVTLANELFFNFGFAGLFFGIIPGFITWFIDRWLRRVRSITVSAVYLAFIFFTYRFTSEPAATLQWVIGSLMVSYLVEVFTRVRIFKKPVMDRLHSV